MTTMTSEPNQLLEGVTPDALDRIVALPDRTLRAAPPTCAGPRLHLLRHRSGLYEALAALQQAGVLRAYGVSVDTLPDMQTAMRTTGCTVMELLFNAFHQDVMAGLDGAAAQGIGLIVKVPLDSGWLAGRYGADSCFGGVRDRWPPDVISRRAAHPAVAHRCCPPAAPGLSSVKAPAWASAACDGL